MSLPIRQLYDSPLTLYTLDTAALSDPIVFQQYRSMLSPARQAKIDGFHLEADRLRSLAAGVLLDAGLSAHGLREASVRMGQNRYGKPCLIDHPDLHFNLSHAGGMAVAVFTDTPAGCDLEVPRRIPWQLAGRVFTPDECAWLQAQPDQDAAFLRLWTLKESFVKATGEGLHLLHRIRLRIVDEVVTVFRDGTPCQGVTFRTYKIGICQAAVCTMAAQRQDLEAFL